MHSSYTLVICSPQLRVQALTQIATMAQLPPPSALNGPVARLPNAPIAQRAKVLALCQSYGYDAAYIPSTQHFSRYRLLVSDMDSTLINIECIDEIADMQGLKAEVSAITERSMQGELDFSASLIERVALLKGVPLSALEQVYQERLRLNPGAEALLSACQQSGCRFMLVSGGFTFFTDKLKTDYGLDYTHANQLEVVNEQLTGRVLGQIVDAQAKKSLLIAQRQALGLQPEQVLAMGDGANDLLMLAEAGLGVAYHAKPVVHAQADVAINYSGLDTLLHFLA